MPCRPGREPLSQSGNPRLHVAWIHRASVMLISLAVACAVLAPRSVGAKDPPASLKNKDTSKAKPLPERAGGATAANPPADPTKPQVVAVVNGDAISREDLGRECLAHYGADILESMINKNLIAVHCREQGIVVTDEEVQQEIDRMARKFALSKEHWLKVLEKERHIKPDRYAKDIIWPTLAMRKLAATQLTVSKQELDEAYESQFGPAVKARLIVLDNPTNAQEVRAKALQHPDDFGALARQFSKDVNSASANGLIQPIRRHMGDQHIEQVAFNLRKGDISPIVPIGNQFAILKCDDRLEPTQADRARVDPILEDAIRDRKLRGVAAGIFKRLQEHTVVDNIYNDPEKSKQMPGIAAVVNGQRITVRELSEECIEHHGIEVLDGLINRRLLEQSTRKHNLTVSQKDIDAEIARAAVAMGHESKNGAPDVDSWLAFLKKNQGLTRDLYIRDQVWPSVALKQLVGKKVHVTDEDLRRGFEANYGPRVRCRAIVLPTQRKAQEVWELARQNNTEKAFGDLAEKHSIEAGSRALRGEVPPIQKYGGQPILEREAFSLKPGELSGIIQVDETFVILRCEGYTKPEKINLQEVRQLIYDDIHEKKLRIAMGEEYQRLQDSSQIDNVLAGTVKAPKKADAPEVETPELSMPTPRMQGPFRK